MALTPRTLHYTYHCRYSGLNDRDADVHRGTARRVPSGNMKDKNTQAGVMRRAGAYIDGRTSRPCHPVLHNHHRPGSSLL